MSFRVHQASRVSRAFLLKLCHLLGHALTLLTRPQLQKSSVVHGIDMTGLVDVLGMIDIVCI